MKSHSRAAAGIVMPSFLLQEKLNDILYTTKALVRAGGVQQKPKKQSEGRARGRRVSYSDDTMSPKQVSFGHDQDQYAGKYGVRGMISDAMN